MAPIPYLSGILSGLTSWTSYFRVALDQTSLRSLASAIAVLSSRDVPQCPGYKVTAVAHAHNSITATLLLAGPACNVHGTDIDSLQLLVEYQTGEQCPPS
jgi:alpha-glucosidase